MQHFTHWISNCWEKKNVDSKEKKNILPVLGKCLVQPVNSYQGNYTFLDKLKMHLAFHSLIYCFKLYFLLINSLPFDPRGFLVQIFFLYKIQIFQTNTLISTREFYSIHFAHTKPTTLSLIFFTDESFVDPLHAVCDFVWVCDCFSKQVMQREHFLIRHSCYACTTNINSQKTTWIQNGCLCPCDKQRTVLFFKIRKVLNSRSHIALIIRYFIWICLHFHVHLGTEIIFASHTE